MKNKNSFKGSCHCGNVSYDFVTSQNIPDLGIRKCDCSFCTKQGNRYISDPEGELRISYANSDLVQRYAFGTKSADFLVCKTCGVVSIAVSEIGGNEYGIVNVNTLENAEHFSRHSKMMSYDDESLEERLERRKKNWIGKVVYTK